MKFSRYFVGAVLLGGALAAGSAPAANAAGAKASFSLDRYRVGQGAKVKVSWKVSGKPKGGSAVLQRTVGTAGRYQTIARLIGGAGTLTVTAPPRGKYGYRVVVLSKKRKTVAKQSRTLYSYADVSMAALAQETTRTIDINGTLFRYFASWGTASPLTVLRFDSTTCRGGTVDLAKSGDAGSEGSLEIVQEFADLQILTVRSNEIEDFGFTLASRGAVQFRLTDTPQDDGYIYLNGKLSCYTANGSTVS